MHPRSSKILMRSSKSFVIFRKCVIFAVHFIGGFLLLRIMKKCAERRKDILEKH